jgi:hypothetical protein
MMMLTRLVLSVAAGFGLWTYIVFYTTRLALDWTNPVTVANAADLVGVGWPLATFLLGVVGWASERWELLRIAAASTAVLIAGHVITQVLVSGASPAFVLSNGAELVAAVYLAALIRDQHGPPHPAR